MAAVKSLPVHHHSAGYILFLFGSLNPSGLFESRITLKPALACLPNYSVAYEETQSNQVFDFRDFVRFQMQSFLTFI